jgi:hypothetical protein
VDEKISPSKFEILVSYYCPRRGKREWGARRRGREINISSVLRRRGGSMVAYLAANK